MAIILNIETATKNCSVSLSEDDRTIAVVEFNEGRFSHAEKLHTFILDLLKMTTKSMRDLDAVAISKGPGSYTGLRIGVSAAKGLCFALGIPLISVPTLSLMAKAINVEKGEFIIPLLDARRMEVYTAIFNSEHQQIENTRAEIIDEKSFQKYLQKNHVHFLGDGAEKCKGVIDSKHAIFLDDFFPSSKEMGILSFEKYVKKDFEDVAYFEPFYLKDFIAGKPKNYLIKES